MDPSGLSTQIDASTKVQAGLAGVLMFNQRIRQLNSISTSAVCVWVKLIINAEEKKTPDFVSNFGHFEINTAQQPP